MWQRFGMPSGKLVWTQRVMRVIVLGSGRPRPPGPEDWRTLPFRRWVDGRVWHTWSTFASQDTSWQAILPGCADQICSLLQGILDDLWLHCWVTYLHNALTYLNIFLFVVLASLYLGYLMGLRPSLPPGGVVPPLGCGRASFGGIRRGFPHPVN